MTRRTIACDMGVIIPSIRLVDNIHLAPTEYAIYIRGTEVARYTIHASQQAAAQTVLDHLLAITAKEGTSVDMDGIDTTDPVGGHPAKWIPADKREAAQAAGYTVIDPTTLISGHLMAAIRQHLSILLTHDDVQKRLDYIKETQPALVETLTRVNMNEGTIRKVLTALLAEGISIRNSSLILEMLIEHAPQAPNKPDIPQLTAYVKAALVNPLA